ncbi:hypothetical protein CY34DRAFT_804186 [Suillus luteus UH-Slu-Lm8-n1]|uniref:Uncharacterized protein n=1 Tax=Suillus luteus UH-Slu-Lm8-n1 TaxID=930992 RepID=A0A0D0B9T1_9AGAM|nr:hypothetical protein CY34DRAFT_804186 [Suillus luteus UH-Slu-Lm8-n1]
MTLNASLTIIKGVIDRAANCEFGYGLGARDEVELLASDSVCGDGLLPRVFEESFKDDGCDPLPLQPKASS